MGVCVVKVFYDEPVILVCLCWPEVGFLVMCTKSEVEPFVEVRGACAERFRCGVQVINGVGCQCQFEVLC